MIINPTSITKTLLWILSPILTYLLLVAIKDLTAYIKYLIRYKPQGIKFKYFPFLGVLGLFIPRKGQKDIGKYAADLINKEHKGEKIIAFNNLNNTQIGLILTDPLLIGKMFLLETENMVRQRFTPSIFKDGMFFKKSKKALHIRSVFNDFFQPEKLKDFVPIIRKIVDSNMEKIKKIYNKEKKNKGDFVKIDLRKITPRMFSEIVNGLMFGNDFPTLEGVTVPEMVGEAAEFNYMKIMRNLFNMLSFGLAGKFRLFKAARDVKKMVKKIEDVILEVIKERESLKERKVNLLDLMLSYNEKEEKEERKLDYETMIGNIILFQGAGVDTSKNTTEGLIDLLSRNRGIRDKLVKNVIPDLYKNKDDKFKYEVYENNDYLNSLVFESLRAFGPAHIGFPKRILKDFEIGGFRLKRGDYVILPFYAIHKNEENFENPFNFEDERFSKERRKDVKRNTFMPFSLGRRACPGKYLAELFIKIIVIAFFENFEVRDNQSNEREMVIRFTYGVKDCVVEVRPRE